MPARQTMALAAVLLVAGCATPTQQEVEAKVDAAAGEQLTDTPETWRSLGSSDPIQVGWIGSFNDPALTALVAEAQAHNRNLAAAAASLEQAQALARQAGASLTPDVNLALGAARGGALGNDGPSASNTLSAGVQVAWEADLWGRIRSGVAQATASAQAAEADFRFAQYSLAANTAIAYFAAVEANLQTQIAKDSLKVLEDTQRIVDAQFKEGMADAQDLALSKSDLASAQDRVATLEGAGRNALRALELLLGRYPGADVEVRDQLPRVPAPPPADVPSGVLERRPDIVAAERRVAAAFNAVAQARAARLPSVSLTGSLGGTSSALSDLLSPSNVAWSLGTNLLAPLFDGGRLRENVVIANAEQEAALAQYADTALRAFSDVETALDQGAVLVDRNRALQEAADQSKEAYRLAELRYKEGESSLLDLLTLQQRMISTRSNLSSVQRLLLEQRVNLNLALGGSWE